MKEGSSQQSLVKNRIKALKIAEMACEEDMKMTQLSEIYSNKEIEDAIAPIQSLINKSEKVMLKVKPDSWQYKMTKRNIGALKGALEILKP